MLRQALVALGLLFVIVNLRVGWQILSWWRRRGDVVLAWPPPKPPFYAINLAIGVMLGVLLFVTAYLVPRPATSLFGVSMMFLYYGYLLPLSTRIRRGLYQDGIWTDSGFMRYVDIGGLTWKGSQTLILASRQKTVGRRLTVPGPHLGEVRRVLREKIGSHAIAFDEGPGLHLGTRDTRESA
ncbi:MAG: hypothetical protein A3J29_20060 [Acidobacteria bacterium RIFCSPLOWO2_12_FULL_67_14b]|nr:MAG: hypothetical protein A3J29_20060 [Acidobacteria bacterium RIFCSPLOWO2_12_FULL_67_14b]